MKPEMLYEDGERKMKSIENEFIHVFAENEGVPVQFTHEEALCWLESKGCTLKKAEQIIEQAVEANWIIRSGKNQYN